MNAWCSSRLGDYQTPESVLSELYPIPELTMVRNEDGICVIYPPQAAEVARNALQDLMVFIPDDDSPSEVVTGITVVPEYYNTTRQPEHWIDQLVMRGFAVLVFMGSVVHGPLRFVAAKDAMLLASLAQFVPPSLRCSYAVLDSPPYLLDKAKKLVAPKPSGTAPSTPEQGSEAWEILQDWVLDVNSFTSQKSLAESGTNWRGRRSAAPSGQSVASGGGQVGTAAPSPGTGLLVATFIGAAAAAFAITLSVSVLFRQQA